METILERHLRSQECVQRSKISIWLTTTLRVPTVNGSMSFVDFVNSNSRSDNLCRVYSSLSCWKWNFCLIELTMRMIKVSSGDDISMLSKVQRHKIRIRREKFNRNRKVFFRQDLVIRIHTVAPHSSQPLLRRTQFNIHNFCVKCSMSRFAFLSLSPSSSRSVYHWCGCCGCYHSLLSLI